MYPTVSVGKPHDEANFELVEADGCWVYLNRRLIISSKVSIGLEGNQYYQRLKITGVRVEQ